MAYKLDEAGATDVTVHFPDLVTDPVPLATGVGATTRVSISTFAWEDFPIFDDMDAEPDSFLWSELGREVELYAVSADVLFTIL